MRNYEERAMDFIKAIYPFIKDDMDAPWILKDKVGEFNSTHSRNVKVMSGCSRCAMITSDYVVKFDYDSECVDEIGGCFNEVSFYEIAEREGYAYLFAKITHVSYMGHDFFIMPRIYGVEYRQERAWEFMTPQEAKWCRKHNLTDLHSGNYGFRNHHVCIFDYGYQNDMVNEPRFTELEAFDRAHPSLAPNQKGLE